jgi:hypothetical protein
VEELGTNLKDLEAIVQGKSTNLRVVEDGNAAFPRKCKESTDLSLSTAAESS